MPKVVLGNTKSQHVADRLQFDGYKDGRRRQGSCWIRSSLITQWTNSGPMAVKTDDYAEGRARSKKILSM